MVVKVAPARDRTQLTHGRPRPAAPILIEQKSELEQAHLVIATPWPDALERRSLRCKFAGFGHRRRNFEPAVAEDS